MNATENLARRHRFSDPTPQQIQGSRLARLVWGLLAVWWLSLAIATFLLARSCHAS